MNICEHQCYMLVVCDLVAVPTIDLYLSSTKYVIQKRGRPPGHVLVQNVKCMHDISLL